MEKLIRDGKVAVVYSPSFGAGWSTWYSEGAETLAMDKRFAELVEAGKRTEAIALAKELFPDMYTGGGGDLTIEWVPVGSQFQIHEYDGSESVLTLDELGLFTA